MPVPTAPLYRVRTPAMVWYQGGTDNYIRWSPSQVHVGAVQWPQPRRLTDRRTSHVPAIAGSGKNLTMAWRGADADRMIWWSRIQTLGSDLTGVEPVWGPQNASRFKTVGFPTLVEHGNRIFMAWMERSPALSGSIQARNQLYWSELLDGPEPRWADKQELWVPTIQDGQGVAIAEHRGQMFMAWRDNSPEGKIWARRHDGQSWVGEPKVVEPEMRCGNVPALASDGVDLHMAVQGADDDHILWTVFEGVTPEGRLKWRAPKPLLDRRTRGGPALHRSFDQGEMVMVWRGTGNDTNLWWSYLHEGQWGPQRAIGDRSLNIGDARASLA